MIGVDEAGRGPMAGPVVAAAVSIKDYHFQSRIADSKTLTEKRRVEAFLEINEKAYVGVGIMAETVIDEVNILNATYFAMNQAVDDLISNIPDKSMADFRGSDEAYLLIDGNQYKSLFPIKYQTVVKGDQSVFSICCASIIAKVTRDRILQMYDQVYPEYQFKSHKGYGTEKHREAIHNHGPSPIQRKSFSFASDIKEAGIRTPWPIKK